MKKTKGENGRLAGTGAFIRRNWIAIRSSLLFVVTLGVWLTWYPNLVDSHALSGFLNFNAQMTGSLLRIFGTNVEVIGTIVSSPDFSMRIGHECTAIVPLVILVCAILAYPSRVRQKVACIAIGVGVLFILNLVRTVTLYYIGAHIPIFFETAHFVVWQSAMILAVVVVWLIWVGRVVNVQSA